MKRQQILSTDIILLKNRMDLSQSMRFARISFPVPEDCAALSVKLDRDTVHPAQIPIALFDAEGHVRILKASEGMSGPYAETYDLSFQHACAGGIPGPLPAGDWKLLLYKRRFVEDIAVHIEIVAEIASPSELPSYEKQIPQVMTNLRTQPFSSDIIKQESGWYCGELHVHSAESTGRTSVEEVLRVAQEKQLDFLALTDHFTASHWLQLQRYSKDFKLLCLQSMEISGDYGHANVHGLTSWVNPLVDDNEELTDFLGLEAPPTMERIADIVHEQEGLFCVNHALSGLVAWRYHEFPMEKADLFEIWCLADNATSFLYPTLWDNYLCQGFHLTGVGSSDSHHPTMEGPWKLGQIRTWVLAEELSQRAVLKALKLGRAYVSYGESRLEFFAEYNGRRWDMGESIPLRTGDECRFIVRISHNPSGNLFLMTGGQIHDIKYFPASEQGTVQTYDFIVKETAMKRIFNGESYFRLEFHEDIVKSKFWGMAYRDQNTMRLLSNPIWIGA